MFGDLALDVVVLAEYLVLKLNLLLHIAFDLQQPLSILSYLLIRLDILLSDASLLYLPFEPLLLPICAL